MWRKRTLKGCKYKGRAYEYIYVSPCKNLWTGERYYNVTCNGANMWNYKSLKEVFSYIEKAKPTDKVVKIPDYKGIPW